MTTSLTPEWLFSHTIRLYYWQADGRGALSTPVPAYQDVTGHIQLYSHVIRRPDGTELPSAGFVSLPHDVADKVDAYTRVEYAGTQYAITNISKPNLGGDTPAYVRAELV